MGWVVNATPWPLYSGKETRYSLYRRLGGPQDRSERVRKMSPGFDPWTVQPVASRYTDCAIPAHVYCKNSFKNYHTVIAILFEVVFSVHVFQLTFVWISQLSMLAHLFCEHEITLSLNAVIHDTVTEVMPLHK
jgi:hypothetical protein